MQRQKYVSGLFDHDCGSNLSTTKEHKQTFDIFLIFPAHAKNGPRWAPMGPGGFFPTNPDLADILGRTDLDFENFYFLDFFGSNISGSGPAWAHPLGPGVGPPTWAGLSEVSILGCSC